MAKQPHLIAIRSLQELAKTVDHPDDVKAIANGVRNLITRVGKAQQVRANPPSEQDITVSKAHKLKPKETENKPNMSSNEAPEKPSDESKLDLGELGKHLYALKKVGDGNLPSDVKSHVKAAHEKLTSRIEDELAK